MKPTSISYKTAQVDDFKIFYREAGDPQAPAILLLHGFPTSSHMFRNLIPELAPQYRVIAPDLPGFGFSDAPDSKSFAYTFDHLAEVMGKFTEVVGLKKFAVYVFDYGAPTGFRLALKYPERIAALITQNGNAYAEGLSDGWTPVRKYWENPTTGKPQRPEILVHFRRRHGGNTQQASKMPTNGLRRKPWRWIRLSWTGRRARKFNSI